MVSDDFKKHWKKELSNFDFEELIEIGKLLLEALSDYEPEPIDY